MNDNESSNESLNEDSPPSSHQTNEHSSRRKRFNLNFKLKVINTHKNGEGINSCAKIYELDRRLVSRWIQSETKILKKKLRREKYAVVSDIDRSHFPILETHLYNWICEKRLQGACLSVTTVKLKAIEFYNTVCAQTNEAKIEFKCSNGWFTNFCHRKNLVIRRITTTGRDLPKNALDIIKNFFGDCQKITNRPNYIAERILNMDETTIYLDQPSNYTFSQKGAKRVKSVTTVAERARVSALFTATASGEKLPIYIIVPRKNDLANYTPPRNVIVEYKIGATFDETIIQDYIKKVLVPYRLINSLDEIVLFLDSAPCHLTNNVKKKFSENQIVSTYIPPRMTNLLQPADVSWFGNLKREYNDKWNKWFIEEERSFSLCGITDQFRLHTSLAHKYVNFQMLIINKNYL
ncbi:unnamed protein product [Brachionus calyciflorus]|uniref:HTH CENPB-type domain-containing protein n=1 Tax=Brachionus calyciflorus TaxID=104777 RepID=A0A814KXQ9_9BILA|nr:unnamed protein product [Brachionus calyciflorus]